MERGESVIKLLHSIWKWNIFWILSILSFFFLLSRLWASLQSLFNDSLPSRPSVHPQTLKWRLMELQYKHRSAVGWNTEWADRRTASVFPQIPVFVLELQQPETTCKHMRIKWKLGWFCADEQMVYSGFMWVLFGKTPWNTFCLYFLNSWIFLHSFIIIIYFLFFYRSHRKTGTISLMWITLKHIQSQMDFFLSGFA